MVDIGHNHICNQDKGNHQKDEFSGGFWKECMSVHFFTSSVGPHPMAL